MAIHIIISGRVQGVFFRDFVKETASKLNLKGFVKNLEDGTLEIFAQGSEEVLNKLISECKKGPGASNVEDIKITKVEDQDYNSFEVH